MMIRQLESGIQIKEHVYNYLIAIKNVVLV